MWPMRINEAGSNDSSSRFREYDPVDKVLSCTPARFSSSSNRVINTADRMVREFDERLCLHQLDTEEGNNAQSAT